MTDAHPVHTPAQPGFRTLGRPLRLPAAVRLMLAAMAVLLVFGSGPLRDWMSNLPLWMDPLALWLMDAANAWHGWMEAAGAAAPYDWVHQAVDDLRSAGLDDPG
jgi:hypothetical protein